MFYSAQKSAEMNKAFSNENIFNIPAIKNSKTPLLPNFEDPRNPYVYLNSIKRKFIL